jgi:DNA-directed RNA polymerase specialized sigma subunit
LTLTVGVLRALLKNLEAFRSLFEAEGVDTITAPGGVLYSLHDLEYLYEARVHLSRRQREAIELFLVQNIREKDVAKIMQVSETNPIAIYATQGLVKICEMIDSGQLPKYRSETARS